MGKNADDMIEGVTCSWCGEFFSESHGYPAVCRACFNEWKKNDGIDAKKAQRILLNQCGLQVAKHKLLG